MGAVLPRNERQARELARIEDTNDACDVWRQIVEDTKNEQAITAAVIRDKVNQHIGHQPDGVP